MVVKCECGCGWSGVDTVTQFLVEEALLARLEFAERLARVEGAGGSGEPELSPHDAAGAAHAAAMRDLGVM